MDQIRNQQDEADSINQTFSEGSTTGTEEFSDAELLSELHNLEIAESNFSAKIAVKPAASQPVVSQPQPLQNDIPDQELQRRLRDLDGPINVINIKEPPN